MLLQNTILQQPSTSPIQSLFKSQKPKHNGYGCHRFPMLSVPVRVPECPDSLLALLFMCQKLGLKLARNGAIKPRNFLKSFVDSTSLLVFTFFHSFSVFFPLFPFFFHSFSFLFLSFHFVAFHV